MPARPIRAGFAAASLLCLVLGAACSSTNDRDDDDNTPDAGQQQTDAGDQTDGGDKTDGGNEECPLTTDCAIAACDGRVCGNGGMCSGGACVEPTQIGEACSGATASKPEGTCTGEGQECSSIESDFSLQAESGNTTCTKVCVTDADCGETDGVSNNCIQTSANKSHCMKGCKDNNACDNNSACLPLSEDFSMCIATCQANADCAFGATCSQTPYGVKVCLPVECPALPATCGEGRACQPIGQQKLCVDACSQENPCPTGLECDTSTGICKPRSGTYYQVCNQQNPCPEPDAFCANPGGGDGICMQVCTDTGVCGEGDPAGTKCEISFTFQGQNAPPPLSVCALPCTAGTTTCPTGSTCKAPGNVTTTYCLP